MLKKRIHIKIGRRGKWTAEEKDYLVKHIYRPYARLARELQRSHLSVNAMAIRMRNEGRLPKEAHGTTWKPHEIQIVKDWIAESNTWFKHAIYKKLPHRTAQSICAKIKQLR